MAGHYITLFMWGFQEHFQSQVEQTVKAVLAEIGLTVEPEIFLVGLLLEGKSNHPICIEPEDGPVRPDDLAGVRSKAEEFVKEDPETHIFHSDARTHRLRQQAIQDRAAARAICEALEQRLDLNFSIAMPTNIGDYQVFTAIGLPPSVAKSVPSLTKDVADDIWLEKIPAGGRAETTAARDLASTV